MQSAVGGELGEVPAAAMKEALSQAAVRHLKGTLGFEVNFNSIRFVSSTSYPCLYRSIFLNSAPGHLDDTVETICFGTNLLSTSEEVRLISFHSPLLPNSILSPLAK